MAKAGKETSSSLDEAIIPSRLSLLLLLLKKVFSHFLTLLPSHAGPQKDEGRKKGGGGGKGRPKKEWEAVRSRGKRRKKGSISLSLSLSLSPPPPFRGPSPLLLPLSSFSPSLLFGRRDVVIHPGTATSQTQSDSLGWEEEEEVEERDERTSRGIFPTHTWASQACLLCDHGERKRKHFLKITLMDASIHGEAN